MSRAQPDAVIAQFFLRGWRMLIDDGDRLLLTLPKQVVELGRSLRLSRLGEVRTFPREHLLAEIRGDA